MKVLFSRAFNCMVNKDATIGGELWHHNRWNLRLGDHTCSISHTRIGELKWLGGHTCSISHTRIGELKCLPPTHTQNVKMLWLP